jgi:multiple sugar transport system ATP-binding protein
MASVAFHHVTKIFANGSQALIDFDLQVDDGEFMVLVGPSGCGKSTALRLLAGLEAVTHGELCIDDVVVNEVSPQQRNIAMVFQNYALYPHMSVRRNLAFPLQMLKLSSAEKQARISRVAELLQLSELLERMPRQLSGGQRQRVAMGRAIVREPQVFLMDEPLSNLDAKMRVQIRAEIAALQQRLQITTLYVTHDQVEAMTLGDRVAVMYQGRLQQVDVPQRLYTSPANTFVASFIGSPGMNVLASQLRQTGAGLQVEVCGHWLNVPTQGRVNPDQLLAYLGQDIYVGLRPEALTLSDASAAMLKLVLVAVEELGHEQLFYFSEAPAMPATLIARRAGTTQVNIASLLALDFDPAALYFFDARGDAIYS